MKDLLTVDQVADQLQVSRWMVYQLMWSRELVSVHIGRCRRIRRGDLAAYIAGLEAAA